jgi:nucleotide-binding universal stress UspA family protein
MTMEPQSTSTSDRIVVGVDGSPASLQGLEWALRYASLSHSIVDVVAAWDWHVNVSLAPIAPDFAPEISAEQMLDSLIQQKRAEHPDLQIDGSVVQGNPASVLEDASKGAALLVIATRGHGELVGLLLDSVSEHCVTHAGCPVLVYRGVPAGSRSGTTTVSEPVSAGPTP